MVENGVISPAAFTGFITAMSSGGSPYRRHPKDLESGGGSGGGFQDYGSVSDPFDIVRTKSASVDSLKRWRVTCLVFFSLNSRRFNWILDINRHLFDIASSTCTECFPSIPIHLGFEKGGREETNHRKNQNSCASHTSK